MRVVTFTDHFLSLTFAFATVTAFVTSTPVLLATASHSLSLSPSSSSLSSLSLRTTPSSSALIQTETAEGGYKNVPSPSAAAVLPTPFSKPQHTTRPLCCERNAEVTLLPSEILSTSLSTTAMRSEGVWGVEGGVVTTYLAVLLLLSVLCNCTIGCVFYSKPQLLTVSNSLVLNLTCCQLGLSLLILPFSTLSVARGAWVLSATWCRSQSYLLVVLLVAQHYSLLAISLDRHYAISNSLRYPYVFTHTLGNSLIAGTWVLGFAMGLPPLLGWGAFTLDRGQLACLVDWRADTVYTAVFLGLVFFLPLLVQCWCYLSIFRAALSHSRRSAKVFPSSTVTATTITTTATTTTTTVTSTGTTTSTTLTGATASASSADSVKEGQRTAGDSRGCPPGSQDSGAVQPGDTGHCCPEQRGDSQVTSAGRCCSEQTGDSQVISTGHCCPELRRDGQVTSAGLCCSEQTGDSQMTSTRHCCPEQTGDSQVTSTGHYCSEQTGDSQMTSTGHCCPEQKGDSQLTSAGHYCSEHRGDSQMTSAGHYCSEHRGDSQMTSTGHCCPDHRWDSQMMPTGHCSPEQRGDSQISKGDSQVTTTGYCSPEQRGDSQVTRGDNQVTSAGHSYLEQRGDSQGTSAGHSCLEQRGDSQGTSAGHSCLEQRGDSQGTSAGHSCLEQRGDSQGTRGDSQVKRRDSQVTTAGRAGSTECKAVKTILLIAASYFLCWALFVTVALLKWSGAKVAPSTDMAAWALLFLSGVLNPLIYGFMNRVTRFEMWRLWSRVSRRLSGRPPAPFVDNDDPISSTWTSALSSGRQPNALWVTPSQRMRRNSKSVTCGARSLEMWTIREEAEVDEGSERVAHDCDVATPSGLNPSCSCSSWRSSANVVHEQNPGTSHRSSGSDCRNLQTQGLGSIGFHNKPLALSPAELHSQPLQLGSRRTCLSHGPRSNHHHHQQQDHHRRKHHLHPHQPVHFRYSQPEDIWDLFSVDPGEQHGNRSRRNSADSVSARRKSSPDVSQQQDYGSCRATRRADPARKRGRDRWKFLSNVHGFLRRHSIGNGDSVEHGDSGASAQPTTTTTAAAADPVISRTTAVDR